MYDARNEFIIGMMWQSIKAVRTAVVDGEPPRPPMIASASNRSGSVWQPKKPWSSLRLAKKYPASSYRWQKCRKIGNATRDRSRVALPVFLHFCQRYELAGYFFAKRRLDHGFFGCQTEPLRFDADAIIGGLGGSPSTTAVRTAFMLCHIIPMMNSFLASYKRDAC